MINTGAEVKEFANGLDDDELVMNIVFTKADLQEIIDAAYGGHHYELSDREIEYMLSGVDDYFWGLDSDEFVDKQEQIRDRIIEDLPKTVREAIWDKINKRSNDER